MTGADAPGAPLPPRAGAARRALRPVARPLKRAARRLRTERDVFGARAGVADLAVFHDFSPPPGSGAHQSLRAVLDECARRGVRIEHGTISPRARSMLEKCTWLRM